MITQKAFSTGASLFFQTNQLKLLILGTACNLPQKYIDGIDAVIKECQ